jgi:phage terminase small subunit
MGLTPKQEKFCQNIVKGMSQADAYRDAYNTENQKDETIWSNACRLMNDSKVIARVKELTEITVKDIKYEIEDCFRETDEILQLAKMTENLQIMLKAVEQKGKLKGLFKDKDTNVNVNVSVMPDVKIDGNKFDLDIGDNGDDRVTGDS